MQMSPFKSENPLSELIFLLLLMLFVQKCCPFQVLKQKPKNNNFAVTQIDTFYINQLGIFP